MIVMETTPAEARQPRTAEPADYFQVGRQGDGLTIYLRYDLFRALDDFAVRDTSREQAGLLVGQVHQQGEQGGFLVVEDAIESPLTDERAGRFSADSWQQAHRLARTRHPGKTVLGWFHTHPGTGLDLSSEEVGVHQRFFTEPWQVVYVVDPVQRERNFHVKQRGVVCAADGFRIFGKQMPAAGPLGEVRSIKPDEKLKERYVERSLENIQRMLRHPTLTAKDYLIVGLLVLNLAVMLFRPTSPAKVDTSRIAFRQTQISEQVAGLRNGLDKLQKQLAAAPAPALRPAAAPAPESAQPSVSDPPPVGGVRFHKVTPGDTLSSIAQTYYKSSAPSLMKRLAHYNGLKSPYFDIYPGETLKLPTWFKK